MSYFDIDSLCDSVQQTKGTPLTEEERHDLELWRKGRDLATLVQTPGWNTALEMMQSYATDAAVSLVNMKPGDERTVVAHAVAYALNDFYTKFRQDVDAAVTASRSTPEVMRRSLQTPAPPESMY